MMIKVEKLDLNCNLTIAVHNAKTGGIIRIIKLHNLVVTAGKNLVRDLLAMESGITGLNYFAVGTDTTAPAVTDTALGAEVFRDTFTKVTTTDLNLNIQYYLSSTDANGYTLAEAGLFGDDATATADSGTLFAHATFTAIAKTSSIAITFSWDVSIA